MTNGSTNQLTSEDAIETDTNPVSVTVWLCARIALFIFSLLLLSLGGVCFAALIGQGLVWWIFVLAILLIAGGCWFTWVSMFGKRKLVDVTFTDLLCNFIASVLTRIF